jgi:hypothetical protein
MVIKHGNLAHRPGVLQLQRRLLLHAEDYTRLAAHTNLASVGRQTLFNLQQPCRA